MVGHRLTLMLSVKYWVIKKLLLIKGVLEEGMVRFGWMMYDAMEMRIPLLNAAIANGE